LREPPITIHSQNLRITALPSVIHDLNNVVGDENHLHHPRPRVLRRSKLRHQERSTPFIRSSSTHHRGGCIATHRDPILAPGLGDGADAEPTDNPIEQFRWLDDDEKTRMRADPDPELDRVSRAKNSDAQRMLNLRPLAVRILPGDDARRGWRAGVRIRAATAFQTPKLLGTTRAIA